MIKENVKIWNRIKDEIQKDNPELNDDDVRLDEGKENELVGRIENRLGRDKRDRIVNKMKTGGMILTEV